MNQQKPCRRSRPGNGTLTLISRSCCHLCHEMEAALQPLLAEYGVALEVQDADADPAWARYDELVPVLLQGDTELCHYFLDEAAVRKALANMRAK